MSEKIKPFDERVRKIEAMSDLLSGKITDVVLDKVGEMLTDNIYDIIPGYAELEETVQTFSGSSEELTSDVKSLKLQLEEMIETNTTNRSDLEFLKNKFNPKFITNIEKAMKTTEASLREIETIKYDQ